MGGGNDCEGGCFHIQSNTKSESSCCESSLPFLDSIASGRDT